MNYVSFDRSILKTHEFTVATNAMKGVWIMLQGYCADLENDGKIANCRTWTPILWGRTVGVALNDVRCDSPLWHWEGEDLVVHHYPKAQQEFYVESRKSGQRGGLARWRKAREASHPITPPSTPEATPPSTPPTGDPSTIRSEVRGGEVKRGEGDAPSHSTALRRRSSPRDLNEVLQVAASIGVQPEAAEAWYVDKSTAGWTNGRGEPFGNWIVELTWHRDRIREKTRAPGGGANIPPGILLKRLEDEARIHPGNPESAGRRSDQLDDRAKFRALQAQITDLRSKLTT